MGRDRVQKEQPEDSSRRRLILGGLKTAGAIAGLGLAGRMFGPFGGVVFGQESGYNSYLMERLKSLPEEEQIFHLNMIENKILDGTWWGNQERAIISFFPERDMTVDNGVTKEMYDMETGKISLRHPAVPFWCYMLSRGVPTLSRKKCHEITHFLNYTSSRNKSDRTLPISEIQANMFFNGYWGWGPERITDKDSWKEKILLKQIMSYTNPEICRIFEEAGIEDVICNHFDDILHLYCGLLGNGKDFSYAHRKASMIVGSASDEFDRGRKIYPKLREAAEATRKWIRKNGIYIQDAEEAGLKTMVLDRLDSYSAGRGIAKRYIRNLTGV